MRRRATHYVTRRDDADDVQIELIQFQRLAPCDAARSLNGALVYMHAARRQGERAYASCGYLRSVRLQLCRKLLDKPTVEYLVVAAL
jgi:hypothetical protein